MIEDATFAFVARRDGELDFAKLCGRRLRWRDIEVTAGAREYTGHVRALDVSDPRNECVVVTPDTPLPDTVVGRTVIFANDGKQDAAYTIAGVTTEPGRTVISVGGTTLVRGFVDPADYAKGCTYNVQPGDRFVIPGSVYVERGEGARNP